jgi:hypothetical protein
MGKGLLTKRIGKRLIMHVTPGEGRVNTKKIIGRS